MIPAAGWVRVSVRAGGIPDGEDCRLVVVAKDGHRESAGTGGSPGRRAGRYALAGFALVDPAQVDAVEVENLDGRLFVSTPIVVTAWTSRHDQPAAAAAAARRLIDTTAT